MNKRSKFVWPEAYCGQLDDYTLKPFSFFDLPSIAENEAAAGPHPWSEKNFLDSLNSGHFCLGILHDGNWVGHAVFSLVLDELELLILSVTPSHKRRGLAQYLLTEVASQAKNNGVEVFHLEVRASNHAAIELYKKSGFEPVGERKRYYAGGEDAILFSKALG